MSDESDTPKPASAPRVLPGESISGSGATQTPRDGGGGRDRRQSRNRSDRGNESGGNRGGGGSRGGDRRRNDNSRSGGQDRRRDDRREKPEDTQDEFKPGAPEDRQETGSGESGDSGSRRRQEKPRKQDKRETGPENHGSSDELSEMAWQLFAKEVSEDGLDLIDEKEAKKLAKKSFKTARIFLSERGKKR